MLPDVYGNVVCQTIRGNPESDSSRRERSAFIWTASAHGGVVDAAIVEVPGHSHKTVVRPPPNGSLPLKPIAGRFMLLEAQDHIDWLLQQVEVDFNTGQTGLVPLLWDGQHRQSVPADGTVEALAESVRQSHQPDYRGGHPTGLAEERCRVRQCASAYFTRG